MKLDWVVKRSKYVPLFLIGTSCAAFSQDPFAEDAFPETPVVEEETLFTPPPPTTASGDNSAAVDVFERHAVVRSLQANPPKTPAELARAVQLMARIKRWDEVTRWLNAIEKSGLTDRTAYQMVDQVGVETFQNLDSPLVDLPPPQKEIARRVVELSNKYRLNPALITGSVLALQGSDSSAWKPAFKTIQSTGYPGIEAFFNALTQEGAPKPNPAMCEALRRLGEPARDAWRVAIRSPHRDVRERLTTLAVGTRDLANTHDLEAGKIRLQEGLRSFVRNRFADDEQTGVRWELGPDGRTLSMRECRPAEVLWERVMTDAENTFRASREEPTSSPLAAAVLLQGNRWSQRNEQGELQTDFPSDVATLWSRTDFLCKVLDEADRYDLATGQFLAIQTLGEPTQPMPVEVRSRLVRGLDSGHRVVRYGAASALMKAILFEKEQGLSTGSFQGRSRLDRVISEMARIVPNRQGMVVGGSGSLRTHLRMLLEEYGYVCEEFSNGGTFVARCKEGAPIDEIYVVDRVIDMDLGDLLQRVRGTPSASKAPIGLLADSLSSRELPFFEADPRLVLGSLPPEAAGLEPTLRQMHWLAQTAPRSLEDQILWKEEALQFLEKERLPTTAPSRNALAASLPQSPAGQRELVHRALDTYLSMPEREQGSQLFVQSVRQFGLQISSETADGLYDVYNDRAKKEPELRELLGRILDAIEANRGEREWSSVRP